MIIFRNYFSPDQRMYETYDCILVYMYMCVLAGGSNVYVDGYRVLEYFITVSKLDVVPTIKLSDGIIQFIRIDEKHEFHHGVGTTSIMFEELSTCAQ